MTRFHSLASAFHGFAATGFAFMAYGFHFLDACLLLVLAIAAMILPLWGIVHSFQSCASQDIAFAGLDERRTRHNRRDRLVSEDSAK